MKATASEDWWLREVRPEWAGHRWGTLHASAPTRLIGEAQTWADAPSGVLYIHARSIRAAYGFAVAISQRAGQALRRDRQPGTRILAVGLLDELVVPDDPDPDHTQQARRTYPAYSSADSRRAYLDEYIRRLREARLTLLRLPPTGDPEQVLDRVADHRRAKDLPTLIASTVPAHLVEPAYGPRIGWRLGFAQPDGSPIGYAPADASVLDLDHPPG